MQPDAKDDFEEMLWQEFGVETEEHLESVEPTLIRLEAEGPSKDRVSGLFRAFHSVKGLTRAMDLAAMADVAHHAENLLGLVRDGQTLLDRRLTDLLLESVDALRALRVVAIETRRSGSRPDALVDRLHQEFRGRTGAIPAPPPRPEPVAAPAVDAPLPPSAVGADALVIDGDMLQFFSELAAEMVPRLVEACARPAPERVAAAFDPLDALHHAASVMGFDGMVEALESLRTALSAPGAAAVAEALSGLTQVLRLMDEVLGTRLTTALERPAAPGLPLVVPDGPPEVAGYAIGPVLRGALTDDAVRLLEQEVTERQRVPYEFIADTEKDPALTRRFLEWLARDTVLVTNRGTIDGGHSRVRFLVTSSLPLSALRDRLQHIDPAGIFVTVEPLSRVVSGSPAASAPVPVPSSSAEPTKGAAGGQVLRVRGEVIDSIMGQVGELLTLSNALEQSFAVTREARALEVLQEALASAPRPAVEALGQLSAFLDRVRDVQDQFRSQIQRLRDQALELRVVPIDTIFSRFPRLVRSLAQAMGKEIHFELSGVETRLDKAMAESLVDPLMHMIRNAVDHGVESQEERQRAGKPAQARVQLRAVSRNNRIEIDLIDDGRGMDAARLRRRAVQKGILTDEQAAALSDAEAYRLIFAPGFSTAEKITDTSGRGVGMDVVLTNVTRLGGSVDIATRLGHGTTFSLRLPLSAAIQSVLVVEARGALLGLPERFLTELVEVEPEQVQRVEGHDALVLRGDVLPLFRLSELLGLQSAGGASGSTLLIRSGIWRLALAVDRVMGRRELYVKEVHPALMTIPGVGGAAVLGSGRVVLLLDGDALVRLAARRLRPRLTGGHRSEETAA